jgi:polyisoprenoid-binding protein YceI
MKKTIILMLMIWSVSVSAQKYYTKTGHTSFKASVGSFEPVAADNKSTTAILDGSTGEVAALVFIKAFDFDIALMQEHFNENYMDSDQYPKASFKGAILNFHELNPGKSVSNCKIKGMLNIRGIVKEIETDGKIELLNNIYKVSAIFIVKPEEFGIKVPKIIRKKIAETVTITLNYELVEKV